MVGKHQKTLNYIGLITILLSIGWYPYAIFNTTLGSEPNGLVIALPPYIFFILSFGILITTLKKDNIFSKLYYYGIFIVMTEIIINFRPWALLLRNLPLYLIMAPLTLIFGIIALLIKNKTIAKTS